MIKSTTEKLLKRRLPGMSIKKRLPFLICILLLFTVAVLGALSYIGVRKATMATATERLVTLTNQLGTMFGQSAVTVAIASKTAVSGTAIEKYISGNTPADSAMALMDRLRTDSTWPVTDLLDSNGTLLLRSALPGRSVALDPGLAGMPDSPSDDTCVVGKIYKSHDSIYYPVTVTITDNRKVIGYLVRWRLQTATPQALEQFSQLLGTGARMHVGNNDNTVWTDLLHITEPPPIDLKTATPVFHYARKNQPSVIAAVSPIPNTPWLILIEFTDSIILKAASTFLGWLLLVGGIMVVTGIVLAWFMSRQITTPLHRLTGAATAIAGGHYDTVVDIKRADELGILAQAFNSMAGELKKAKEDLEKKVKDRTRQLETVNKELEAFSYSVSHDLRAPLRSINGYATILEEDYAVKLDDEARRLTGKIVSNGKKMGMLIDDLISFSQVVRKEIEYQAVNMQQLASSCVEEVLGSGNTAYGVTIGGLPPCQGDEGLLRQVWLNLISNAVKYSSKKAQPVIEIGYSKAGEDEFYFVRDNGAGFDMKYTGKLFGVFQRLHSNKEFEGTGIGLALTKRIIDRHGGVIFAEARIGEGACFYFKPGKYSFYE